MNLTTSTTIDVALLLGMASLIIGAANAINASRKMHDNETRKQLDIEKNFIKINTKFDNFVENIEKMMVENQRNTNELRKLSEEMIKSNEHIETLFRYKDNHEKRISTLENKVK